MISNGEFACILHYNAQLSLVVLCYAPASSTTTFHTKLNFYGTKCDLSVNIDVSRQGTNITLLRTLHHGLSTEVHLTHLRLAKAVWMREASYLQESPQGDEHRTCFLGVLE